MKERIDEVLAAEKEAGALLEEARHRADAIRQQADARAADAARTAREQAQAETRAAVEHAEREAEERYLREIAAAEAEGEAALEANRAVLDRLVERIVALIAQPRHKVQDVPGAWSTGRSGPERSEGMSKTTGPPPGGG